MAQASPPDEMAIKGTHEFVLDVVKKQCAPSKEIHILDFAAGSGSLTRRLLDAGYNVEACDLVPELFRVKEVECRKADASAPLPFDDATFDLVIAVELVEHIDAHLDFFRELVRILKPGGKTLFTTPNILSLKSRARFLFTGYFYSFGPLDPNEYNPVKQHISPFTIDRYRFILKRAGLTLSSFQTDKRQTTSTLLLWLWPFIRLATLRYFGRNDRAQFQNTLPVLLGRKAAIIATKDDSENKDSAACDSS